MHDVLKDKIHRFLEGETSLTHARDIESLIVQSFPENHPAQEIADLLAQYSPGGGPFLYSEQQLQVPLKELLNLL